MEYVVYIDVYFLTGCFFNFLSLYLTAILLRMQVHMFRCLTAALVGSLWNCLLLLHPMKSPTAELVLTVLGIGSLMNALLFGDIWYLEIQEEEKKCRKGYRFQNAVRILRRCLAADLSLLLSSMILGGCVSFAKEQFFLSDWETLAVTGLLTGAVGLLLGDLFLPVKLGKERFSVSLFYKEKCREFTALADSGNRLRVPENGKAVTLVSYDALKGFCDWVSGGFYIPYQSVGTEHGLLFAITFEKMEIRKNGTCITIENPAVAIVKESLSSNGDFNMLLPEEYVTEISGCRTRRRKSL